MAKRYKRKNGMTKIQPAVDTMQFDITIASGTTKYIDLSQCASLINRRFYRQGINWVVGGFKFATAPAQGTVAISKLQNTWITSGAWEKSMRVWSRMNEEALEESTVRPRFLDFKIYADAGHHSAGFAANLLPSVGTIGSLSTAAAGEWEPSKVVVPNTAGAVGAVNNFEIIATGANYPGGGASGLNAVSMVEGYAASRGLPNVIDPNTPDDAADVNGATPENWMSALFNEGTSQDDQVLTDMITENNVAPYPFENGPIVGGGTYTDTQYPGGANQLNLMQLHDVSGITGTTIGGDTMLRGGNFPCGLVRIDWTGDAALDGILLVNLVPGPHRGYLCESMVEM